MKVLRVALGVLLAALVCACGTQPASVETGSGAHIDETGLSCESDRFAQVIATSLPEGRQQSLETAVNTFLDETWPQIPVRLADRREASGTFVISKSVLEGELLESEHQGVLVEISDSERIVTQITVLKDNDSYYVGYALACNETMAFGAGASGDEVTFERVDE